MSEDRAALSAVVITRNEEARLPRCLSSLSFVDEIVLVDSGSTDRTLEIAREFGCRVFVEEWKGFGAQKQSGVDKCRNDFVLILDADERVPGDSVKLVQETLRGRGAQAYSLKRKNHIGKRWIRHSGWWPDRVVRLLDRRACRVEGSVHEKVVVSGRTAHLDAVIEHYSYDNYSQMVDKLNLYSSLSAAALAAQDKRASRLAPVVHAAWMFFRTLVVKRGFMDGFDGLVISALNAFKTFLKYVKLLERNSTRR